MIRSVNNSIIYVSLFFCVVSMARGSVFVDSFDRSDNATVGNGWTETGDLDKVAPQIVGNEVSFVMLDSAGARAISSLERTFTPAVPVVSVDLKFPTAYHAQTGPDRMKLEVTGSDGNIITVLLGIASIDPNTLDAQEVYTYYNGVPQTFVLTGDYRQYHNYKVEVTAAGGVKVYLDGALRWQTIDGVMGNIVTAKIIADRWWSWHQFYADNFKAIGAPANCAEVTLLGALLNGDFNGDCKVDLSDMKTFAQNWLVCNEPFNSACGS